MYKIAAMVCPMIEYSLRVERIVKTFGMVNANPETIKGSECITIINGFSNLMMEVLVNFATDKNLINFYTHISLGVWPREGCGCQECHLEEEGTTSP